MAYCAYCGSYVAHVSNAPCASCGSPTNGAPRRPMPKGGGSIKPGVIIAAVAVGGFVLLAIVGILAAIAIPNMLTAMQRARQDQTMADMRRIAAKLEAHIQEKKAAPPGHSVSEISDALGGVPTIDGWGTLYGYEAYEDGSYVIVSGGADMRFEQDSLGDYEARITSNFDCDIVYADGEFVQQPGDH